MKSCEEEDVEITEDAKKLLTKFGEHTSLRYALVSAFCRFWFLFIFLCFLGFEI